MNKREELKRNEEQIKSTLKKLIKKSKDGIKMIEQIEQCYGVIGEASEGKVSEEYKKEVEKRSQMKADLTNSMNYYLDMYKKNFGEYKEK